MLLIADFLPFKQHLGLLHLNRPFRVVLPFPPPRESKPPDKPAHHTPCTSTSTSTGLIPGCPALEYVILDAKIRRFFNRDTLTRGWAVQRLLSAAPRLFYVLAVDGDWDLTLLPGGW